MKISHIASVLALTSICLIGIICPPLSALAQTNSAAVKLTNGVDEPLISSALVWFKDRTPTEFRAYLKTIPIHRLDEKTRLREVQKHGLKLEQSINPRDARFRPQPLRIVRQLSPVAEFHGWSDLKVMFYEDRTPYLALIGNEVVCVSTGLLEAVPDDEELTALFAHELAHRYVFYNYLEALKADRMAKVRELELFCDGVAIITMLSMDRDPAAYTRSVRRLVEWDRAHGVKAKEPRTHPAVETRAEFYARLIRFVRVQEVKVAKEPPSASNR